MRLGELVLLCFTAAGIFCPQEFFKHIGMPRWAVLLGAPALLALGRLEGRYALWILAVIGGIFAGGLGDKRAFLRLALCVLLAGAAAVGLAFLQADRSSQQGLAAGLICAAICCLAAKKSPKARLCAAMLWIPLADLAACAAMNMGYYYIPNMEGALFDAGMICLGVTALFSAAAGALSRLRTA